MHPTRLRLLEHGLSIAREKGLRGLKVREVATRSGVNLGSFVYHFGHREAYVAELVELWYAPLHEQLLRSVAAADGRPAIERLEAAVLQVLDWVGCNAGIVAHLVADAVAGEPGVRDFARRLPGRHPTLMLRLMREAQAEGSIAAGDARQLMFVVMTATGLPLVALGILPAQADWLPGFDALRAALADPQAVRRRLRWALRGIAAPSDRP
ncbi:MAG: TetR/AcrR family transcriptional regulator [Burkholderiales bacterium]|nr:TetR/AcrR family transcriptional regulator [Burkholderiales bacterium]